MVSIKLKSPGVLGQEEILLEVFINKYLPIKYQSVSCSVLYTVMNLHISMSPLKRIYRKHLKSRYAHFNSSVWSLR